MSHPSDDIQADDSQLSPNPTAQPASRQDTPSDDTDWADMENALSDDASSTQPSTMSASGTKAAHQTIADVSPLSLVETAFLASTASLVWLVSYYLSIGPWMRIVFPIPIALVYLRWGNRAAWMSALTTGLLLSVLMGPYLSLLFFIPYGLLGVQLGALWYRRAGWYLSVALGTIVATLSFFFRVWLLSAFIGEDLWLYLTNRITDLLEWMITYLVDWGILGIGMLGQPNITVIQLATIVMIITSDVVYLFTVHLAAWLLLERLGNPIPTPPRWVQVLLDEEG
ncbi:MAG TPA: DUF2232 domain-containing protein [Elainellaceae cyanobacterium]